MALRIDATGEYASRANPWTGGPITIAFWMRRTSTSSQHMAGLVDTDDASPSETGDPRVVVRTSSGSVMSCTYVGNGGTTNNPTTATYAGSTWTQITARFRGTGTTLTQCAVSVNGTHDTFSSSTSRDLSVNGTLDQFWLGASGVNSNAEFAHVALYLAELSDSQVAELQTTLPNAITGATPSFYESLIGSEGGFTLNGGATIDSTNDGTLPSLSGGDTTAPVLTSPVGTTTGSTTATVGATTDEGNGTLYAFVSTSATPPSDSDLIAGTGAVWAGSVAVSSTGAKTLNATGLTASTGYYAHLLHRDAASNDSNTVTSAQFTTDAAPSGPTINTQPSNATVTEGATANFTVAATTSGGSLSYQWQRNPGGVGSWANVTTGTGGTTASYTTAATTVSGGDANNADTFRCLVTDSNGTTTSSAATLTVNAATSGDIRLAIGIDWEQGAEFASQTARHWSVWEADHSAMRHSGTSLSTSSGGVATIDINDSAHFVVGDTVYFTISFDDGETDPLDRTVRTVGGYIVLTAQA